MDSTNFLNTALGQQTIYLMGASFIIGSLTTIFILLILDMLGAIRAQSDEQLRLIEELEVDDFDSEEV